ncbi:5'/3'-nucleotidase SurE [Candidatus Liberibacter solanacearum]|uniref:5'/3'-nucleotidase SurE n=1 Tax=Candidatus Liberibacter solanacearum TaxID=556287 RepID=UPI001FD8A200|nr:5'/3'-nucleotidase SurE [Candidatus Liberibacter solanacearum]
MLDIQWIRQNPDTFDIALKKRNLEPQSECILSLDTQYRSLIKKIEKIRAQRNSKSEQIGQAIAKGNLLLADTIKAEVSTIKEQLPLLEEKEKEIKSSLNQILSCIPNIPLEDVPIGANEKENILIRSVGNKPNAIHLSKEHFEIGEELGLMDFDRSAKLSGARFSILASHLALLERALGQFMLDLHTSEHGYTEVSAPLLMKPCMAQDSFPNLQTNTSNHVAYSGTLAAAFEGSLQGIRSFALSQAYTYENMIPWGVAKTHAPKILQQLLKTNIPNSTLFNINFPRCSPQNVRGAVITAQGKPYFSIDAKQISEDGNLSHYSLDFRDRLETMCEKSDVFAIQNDMISVTPIKTDLTDYDSQKCISLAFEI